MHQHNSILGNDDDDEKEGGSSGSVDGGRRSRHSEDQRGETRRGADFSLSSWTPQRSNNGRGTDRVPEQFAGSLQNHRQQLHQQQNHQQLPHQLEETEWASLLQQLRTNQNQEQFQQQPRNVSLVSWPLIGNNSSTTTGMVLRGIAAPDDDCGAVGVGTLPLLDYAHFRGAAPPRARAPPAAHNSTSTTRSVFPAQQNHPPQDDGTRSSSSIASRLFQPQHREQQQQESFSDPRLLTFLHREQQQRNAYTFPHREQQQQSHQHHSGGAYSIQQQYQFPFSSNDQPASYGTQGRIHEQRNQHDSLLHRRVQQQQSEGRSAGGVWSAAPGGVLQQHTVGLTTNIPSRVGAPSHQHDRSSTTVARPEGTGILHHLLRSSSTSHVGVGPPMYGNPAQNNNSSAVRTFPLSALSATGSFPTTTTGNIDISLYYPEPQLHRQRVELPAFASSPQQERREGKQGPPTATDSPLIEKESIRKEQDDREIKRIFACKARGVTSDHNSKTAILILKSNAKHGDGLICCHPECAKNGIKFVYCSVCDAPVAKINFTTRHKHPEQFLTTDRPPLDQTSPRCHQQQHHDKGSRAHQNIRSATNRSHLQEEEDPEKHSSVLPTVKRARHSSGFSPPESPMEESIMHDERSQRWIELMRRRPPSEDREMMKKWIAEVVISTDPSGSVMLDDQVLDTRPPASPPPPSSHATVPPAARNDASQKMPADDDAVPVPVSAAASIPLADDSSHQLLVSEVLRELALKRQHNKRRRKNTTTGNDSEDLSDM